MKKLITTIYENKTKILPILVFLLGVILRTIYLGEIPGGYHRDEAYGAWNALSLYMDGIDSAGHSYPVYFEAWAHGQNALNSYLMLPLIFLNGGHITPLVVRLPQVILSLFTLVAVYSLMKRMFSPQAALWSLFLLAICPWHVMMSRWGLESNLAPGFLILGLCFWILSLDNPKYLVLSALSYGLSLYCYATIWPIVPIMVLFQLGYSLITKKLNFSKWVLFFGIILIALGLPLMLFLLVNMEILPEFRIGCFSIYKMTSFRSGELAKSLKDVLANIYNFIRLLVFQDIGRPYDVIMPYGFFYNIGRIFGVIGTLVVIAKSIMGLVKRTFTYEIFLFIQLIGAGIVACLVTVSMTQINCLYIPMVLCEAIGILFVKEKLQNALNRYVHHQASLWISKAFLPVIFCIYLISLAGFQTAYYTDYKALVSAHFQEGSDEAVRYAQKCALEKGCSVYVNAGLKYPNILLATETGAKEYLDTLVYSQNLPAPSQFDCNGVTFYMGINFENIEPNQIYLLYYTETGYFTDYNVTQFFDWYVAVPK